MENGAQDISVTEIAAQGDVTLVVGPERAEIKVHSAFLRAASLVFEAMLKPCFKEGRRLQEDGAVNIRLPEDNAQAMEIVMSVIHGRNDEIGESLEPRMLLRVAVVVDKYDCAEAMTYAISIWFNSAASIKSSKKNVKIALAAILLDRNESFDSVTAALLRHHAGSFVDLVKKYESIGDPKMIYEIAARLEERRNSVRADWFRSVMHGPYHASRSIDNRDSYSRFDIFLYGLIEADKISLSRTIQKLEHLMWLPPASGSEGAWTKPAPTPKGVEDLRNMLKTFKENLELESGLCLKCIKTGEEHRSHDWDEEEEEEEEEEQAADLDMQITWDQF